MPRTEVPTVEIRPQAGPQSMFLSSSADITVYGGAAGGGKTWAILAEPLRHMNVSGFSAVIFRRTFPMIENEGGLWEESGKLYPQLGAKPQKTSMKWTFPSKMTVRFAHMQHETDKHNWQGAQIPFIGFDELTQFTEDQFFYLMSRNRTMSGIKPYIRATCNPDATSWVKRFLAPWVDRFSELKAESGEILWMVRKDNKIHWYKSQQEAIDDNSQLLVSGVDPKHLIKSVTFIFASIYDNKKLIEANPEYLGSLLSLGLVERKRLLEGDWDVLPEAGKVFNREWFDVVEPNEVPESDDQFHAWDVRFWDFAASEKTTKGDDPDWSVGTRIRKHNGKFYVMDVKRFRATPGDLEARIKQIAKDEPAVPIRFEEEGGSSGKIAVRHIITELAGYDVRAIRPQGDKVTRAMPLASQSEVGNVKIARGAWNEQWLTELHHFPDADHDDCVDSASGAFTYIARYGADVIHGPDIWSV
jgi:predicted phage terminase large subunit-like protein